MLSSTSYTRKHSIFLVICFGDPFISRRACVKIQTDENDDPTLLVSGESEKELARAKRLMGPEWVAKMKQR